MKIFFSACYILLFAPIGAFAQMAIGDTMMLFFIGGQSNMTGFGYVNDLPDSLNKTFKDVWIFEGNQVGDGEKYGGLGTWTPLKPGHGDGFSSDGKSNNYSDRFGVELSFAERLQKLYPGKKIALVKYARPGSGIDSLAQGNFGCWEPDFIGNGVMNQYDFFLQTIRGAYAAGDINGDGKLDVLVPKGIIWMQGESDASFNEEIAGRYFANLKRLMDLIRGSLREDDLPVVIGKISDSRDDTDGRVWEYGELVEYAQEKYAKTDGQAAVVRNARFYKFSDPWHYDSAGYIDLGKAFADAWESILKD